MTHHAHRPTVAFLIDTFGARGTYMDIVASGVMSAAEAHDINLFCVPGGTLRPLGDAAQPLPRKILYPLLIRASADGVIIMGSVGSYGLSEELINFHRAYHAQGLPSVSIGTPLASIPSVIVDNEQGLRDAITHLIEVHQHRRIAFIRGPEGVPEAQIRYRVYTEVLAAHGIPLDPALVLPGTFVMPAGSEAIRVLCDQRRVTFQAVVAANDLMALGAMDELQRRNILVPYDVAVVGFDDIDSGRLAIPSLTTVRQPMARLGSQAMEVLLAQIRGEPAPDLVMLPTEMVIRLSCGCYEPMITHISLQSEPTAMPGGSAYTAPPEEIATQLEQTIGATIAAPPDWACTLVENLLADLRGAAAGQFLNALDRLLRHIVKRNRDVSQWQEVISVLRALILATLHDPPTMMRLDALCHQARLFIQSIVQKLEAQRHTRHAQQQNLFHAISQRLITTIHLESLLEVMACELPRLGMRQCYLALYTAADIIDHAPESACLRLAYDATRPAGQTRIPIASAGQIFPTCELIPPEMRPQGRFTLIIEPLYFKEHQFGFCLVEAALEDSAAYEVLGTLISSALQAALLIEKRRSAEEALRRLNEELEERVNERTAELAKERNLLRTLIDHLPDYIYAKDTQSRFLLANTALAGVMGVPDPEALMGKTDFDFYPPTLAAQYHQDEREVLQAGHPLINREEPIIHPLTGTEGWLLTTKVPLYDSQEEIVGLVGIGRDITQMKRAHAQLLRLEKAVETMSLGITITDLTGKIIYVNPAEACLHGYTVEELIGQDARLFAPPEYRQPFTLERIRDWKGVRRESLNIRKDGSVFPVWLISEVVRTENGAPIALVTSCEDITDRKQAEEELRKYREHLEELVQERTAELIVAHWEVQQKNAQLQELNASKDKFFSIISHDLRSPFNFILGYSQLLDENLERFTHAEIRGKLEKLRKSAEQLYLLLENLLTWSRIQRGLVEYRPALVNLNEIIEDILALFASKAAQKEILLRQSGEPALQVYADYQMLHTVLRNLVSNAIKFTPTGGSIDIAAHPYDEKQVVMAVTDTGRGIPPADLSKLFRIDVRYTQVGTAGEPGTGLGLNLCKELVEKNGGTIWVESTVGQGTVFRFTLPQSGPAQHTC